MIYEKEAKWWDKHDLGDYWDEFKDVDIVFDLKKPRDEILPIRIQKSLKTKLESIARSKGLNVSTFARMILLEKLQTIGK